jgi:hypothetical protein
LGKVNPYRVYDQTANVGWVSIGIDHDTSSFAVESIRRWWNRMGQQAYPEAKHLLITADGGGSNGYRIRLWKIELQRFADEQGLAFIRHRQTQTDILPCRHGRAKTIRAQRAPTIYPLACPPADKAFAKFTRREAVIYSRNCQTLGVLRQSRGFTLD